MATFDKAIGTVLEHEGGFVANPADPGGATNWGISLRWLRAQGLLGDVDHDGDVDADDIRNLTRNQAIALYRDKFWRASYEWMIQPLAIKVLDTAVNVGPERAHRILQEALNAIGLPVSVDGICGVQTVKACIAAGPENLDQLLMEFRAAQSVYYAGLAIDKPDLRRFLKGWMRRAAS